jgi:ribonuclease HI
MTDFAAYDPEHNNEKHAQSGAAHTQNTRKTVEIYTDGACSGNPGPGGWAAILMYRGREKVISGYEPDTTNNRMELLAAIRALECLKEPCEAVIYSDSSYLVNAFDKNWIAKWRRNNWRLSDDAGEVKNIDLWRTLSEFAGLHRARFVKVEGHSDNMLNDRCDKLAVSEIKTHKK